MRRAAGWSIVLAAAGAFLLGGLAASRGWPPFSLLRATTGAPAPADLVALRFRFAPSRRLIEDTDKAPVPCPPQTPTTAVLLLIGQSNAANHGGQRFAAEHADRVVAFHAGRCWPAVSPLLGASGFGGEYWSLLGDMLVASGTYERVILVPGAVNTSKVAQWAKGGPLDPAPLAGEVQRAGYRMTHVLWHQGETDFEHGTSREDYRRHVLLMVDALRAAGVTAPVLVSVASRCDPTGKPFRRDNPVAEAQRGLPDPARGILAGVDSDGLLGPLDRYDSCHFAGSGQRKVAAEWHRLIVGLQRK